MRETGSMVLFMWWYSMSMALGLRSAALRYPASAARVTSHLEQDERISRGMAAWGRVSCSF